MHVANDIPTEMSQIRTLEDWIRFDEARADVDDISAICLELNRAALAKRKGRRTRR